MGTRGPKTNSRNQNRRPRVTISISTKTLEKINRECERTGRVQYRFLGDIIEDWFENQQKKEVVAY